MSSVLIDEQSNTTSSTVMAMDPQSTGVGGNVQSDSMGTGLDANGVSQSFSRVDGSGGSSNPINSSNSNQATTSFSNEGIQYIHNSGPSTQQASVNVDSNSNTNNESSLSNPSFSQDFNLKPGLFITPISMLADLDNIIGDDQEYNQEAFEVVHGNITVKPTTRPKKRKRTDLKPDGSYNEGVQLKQMKKLIDELQTTECLYNINDLIGQGQIVKARRDNRNVKIAVIVSGLPSVDRRIRDSIGHAITTTLLNESFTPEHVAIIQNPCANNPNHVPAYWNLLSLIYRGVHYQDACDIHSLISLLLESLIEQNADIKNNYKPKSNKFSNNSTFFPNYL